MFYAQHTPSTMSWEHLLDQALLAKGFLNSVSAEGTDLHISVNGSAYLSTRKSGT